ncbi:hypothetical protein L3Q67_01750 [Saccharothrix sp. AJ9571]|nr:hypothetical protein L3Q67_01750 [Saccharothrix sp. AJ9571]
MTRYGITFPGLCLASGAGVYLGAVPIGYLALAFTAVIEPVMLGALPGALIIGSLIGLIVSYSTRRRIRPRLSRRHQRFILAGAATMPGALFVGQFPHVTTGQTTTHWAFGFILGCGVAGMVLYYRWRKRLAMQRYTPRAAGQQQAATT